MPAEKNTTENTDELDINFEKIKKFFKNTINTIKDITTTEKTTETQKQETPHQQTENLKTEIKKTKEFITTNKTAITLILLILLQFLPNYGFFPWGGIHSRLQIQEANFKDKNAIDLVYSEYLQQIYTSIQKQQPNLPQENTLELAKQELNKIFNTDPRIQNKINQIKNGIKTEITYTENNKKYVLPYDIDPFYYFRLANNVLKKGHTGDTLKNNRPWDSHVVAPIGSNATIELHPYTLAYINKIAKLYDPNIPLMESSAYFPIIFILIGTIAMFFIGKSLTNNLGGFLTATLYSINHISITKTAWGFADTDAYNLSIPALFILLFVQGLTTQKIKNKITLIAMSSILLATYSFAWSGWWYLLIITAIATPIYIVYILLNKHKNKDSTNTKIKETNIKNITITLTIFLLLNTLLISTVLSYKEYGQADLTEGIKMLGKQLLGPLSFKQIKQATRTDLWPNVYTTVAELTTIPITSIIEKTGGYTLFLFAIIGFTLLLKNKQPTNQQILYGLFTILLTLSGFYATTKGQRFILLLIIPLTITASTAIVEIYKKISTIQNNKTTKIIAIIFILITVTQITSTNATKTEYWLNNVIPFTNNAWWQTLNNIKEDSQKNAIITSWWDFGHVFSYISDRPVTFDGASQNTPMAYWVGKVLSTNNETEAIGILKMLACGSNKAYDTTYEQNNDIFKTLKIINDLTKIPEKNNAETYLKKQEINNPEEILKYTHCDPPQNYFITSQDMMNKAAAWSHFANWDFQKAYILQTLKNTPQDDAIQYMIDNFNYTKKQATNSYETAQSITTQEETEQWIAPQWTYSDIIPCKTTPTIINCNNRIIINPKNYETKIKINNNYETPTNIIYINENTGKLINKQFENSTSNIAVTLMKDEDNNNYGLLSTPQLTTSIFNRLMYFDGHELTKFKLFTKRKLITGGYATTWKINWNGTTPQIMPSLQTKSEIQTDSTIQINILASLQNGEIVDSTIINWNTIQLTQESDFDKYQTKPRIRKMGANQIIPQIEKELIGMKPKQQKTIKINAQDFDSTNEQIKQKIGNNTITFKIRIEKIQ